jgi:hypothetical protein
MLRTDVQLYKKRKSIATFNPKEKNAVVSSFVSTTTIHLSNNINRETYYLG